MQKERFPSEQHITVVATLLWNLGFVGFFANAFLLCKYLRRPWKSIPPLPLPSLVIAQCVVNLVLVAALLLATLTLSTDMEDAGVTVGRVSLVMSVGGMLYSWFSQVVMTLCGIWEQHQPRSSRTGQGVADGGTVTWQADDVQSAVRGGSPHSGRRPRTQRHNPQAARRREGAAVVGSSSPVASSDVTETREGREEGPEGDGARRSPAAGGAAARTEIDGGSCSEEMRSTQCQKQAGSWLLIRCFILSLIVAFTLHVTVPPTRLLCHSLDPFQRTYLMDEGEDVSPEAAKAEISSKTPFMMMIIGSYLVGFLVNLFSLLRHCCQRLVSMSSASRNDNAREGLEAAVGEDRVRELITTAFRPAILAVLRFRWPRVSAEDRWSADQHCNKSNNDQMPQQWAERRQSGGTSSIHLNTRNSAKSESDEQISEDAFKTSSERCDKQAESANQRKIFFEEKEVVDVPYIDDKGGICQSKINSDILPLSGSVINAVESKVTFDSSLDLDFFETDEYLMLFSDVALDLDIHKGDPVLDRPIEYPADEWPLDGELWQVIADPQGETLDGREVSFSMKRKQKTTNTASSQFPQRHADDIENAAQCGDHVTSHKEEAEAADVIINKSSPAPWSAAWAECRERESETPKLTSLESPPPVSSGPLRVERSPRKTSARWTRLTVRRQPQLSESAADNPTAPTGDSEQDNPCLAASKRAAIDLAAPSCDDNNSARSGARSLRALKAGVPVPQTLKAGVPVPQALKAGVPVPQALKAGVPVPQTLKAGVPVPQTLKAGVHGRQELPGNRAETYDNEGIKAAYHLGQTLPTKPSEHLRLFPLGYPSQSVGHLIPNLRCHLLPRKGVHSAAKRFEKRWPRSIDVALLHAEFPAVAEELEEVIKQVCAQDVTEGQRKTKHWKVEKPSSTTKSREGFELPALHRCSRSKYGAEHLCNGNAKVSRNQQSRFTIYSENAKLKTDNPSRLGNSPQGDCIARQKQQLMPSPDEDDLPAVERQPSDIGYNLPSPSPAQQPRYGGIMPDRPGAAFGGCGGDGRGDAGRTGSVAARATYRTGRPPRARRLVQRRPATRYQCKCWLGLLLHVLVCLPFCVSLLPGVWRGQDCQTRFFLTQAFRVLFYLHVVVNPLWLISFHGRQLFRD